MVGREDRAGGRTAQADKLAPVRRRVQERVEGAGCGRGIGAGLTGRASGASQTEAFRFVSRW